MRNATAKHLSFASNQDHPNIIIYIIATMSSSISCNDNQNYLVKQGRTTSRVLAPPGGFTSLSFGCEEPEPKKKEGTEQHRKLRAHV